MELAPPFAMTEEQKQSLLRMFILFVGVPLLMCVDMAVRVSKGQRRALAAEKKNL